MTDKPFVDRIKSLIKKHAGENNSEFARLLGIRPQNIDHWINRGSFPSDQHLANLKEKLNLNINWLITGIGPTYLSNEQPGQVAEPKAAYERKIDHLTDDEREYVEKLLYILRRKQPVTVIAIKNNLDAFLLNPEIEPIAPEQEQKGGKSA